MKKIDFDKFEKFILSPARKIATLLTAITLLSAIFFALFLLYGMIKGIATNEYPDIKFRVSDFTRMNLVDPGEKDETFQSDEELLANEILDDLDKGFEKTAYRIFTDDRGLAVMRQHLPYNQRFFPENEIEEKIEMAFKNARKTFRNNSKRSLAAKLTSLGSSYREHYAGELSDYLMEAFKNGVKVFSVINARNIELNVISDIGRSTAYKHFNRLYGKEIFKLKNKKNSANEKIFGSQMLVLYTSIFFLTIILLIMGLIIVLMRIEKKVSGRY